jgi:hypothetical protein
MSNEPIDNEGETYSNTIKDRIFIRLAIALKDPDVLGDLWIDLYRLEVANRVFTQEIKGEFVRWLKCNVFAT